MPNREKVIYSIERCVSHVPDACRDCSYDIYGEYNACVDKLLRDALELLKEHEPVKPVKEQIFSYIFGWNCGACGFPLLSDGYTYCPHCGKEVKWNG